MGCKALPPLGLFATASLLILGWAMPMVNSETVKSAHCPSLRHLLSSLGAGAGARKSVKGLACQSCVCQPS